MATLPQSVPNLVSGLARPPRARGRRLLDELANRDASLAVPLSVAPELAAPGPHLSPLVRRWSVDLFAGLVVGLVTVTFSISCATLIFSGPLASLLPIGMVSAVIGDCVTAIVVARRSSLSFTIAGPDSHGSAVLGVMAASIAAAVADPAAAAATVLAAVALSSILTGLLLFTLGRLKVAHCVRFIPFPA
jgi:MFS superfamily sulfate permease-like transporter